MFPVQTSMREIVLCATAFSLSMLLADVGLYPDPDVDIELRKYSLMDCESLSHRNYAVEDESSLYQAVYRAAAECTFRGHHPSGPITEN